MELKLMKLLSLPRNRPLFLSLIVGLSCWTLFAVFVADCGRWTVKNEVMYELMPLNRTRAFQNHSCSNISSPLAESRNIAFSVLQLKTPHFLPSSMYKNPCWIDDQEVSRHLMCVPYVFLAGFPKCATSDLYSRMVAHPLVSSPLNKEPLFWSWSVFHQYKFQKCQDMDSLNSSTSCLIRMYASSFQDATDDIRLNKKIDEDPADGSSRRQSRGFVNKTRITLDFWKMFREEWTNLRQQEIQKIPNPMITVDGSTGNAWNETSWRMILENRHLSEPIALNPDIIHKVNPEARIIMIMRDPVHRAYSMYRCAPRNHSIEEFHDFVVEFISKFEGCLKVSSLRVCTFDGRPTWGPYADLEAGMYYVHVKEWLHRFPRENFLFLRTEDYNRDMSGVLRQIFKFLELPLLSTQAMKAICKMQQKNVSGSGKKGPTMLPETKEILTTFYAQYNRNLADLLGDDRFTWQDIAEADTDRELNALDADGGKKN